MTQYRRVWMRGAAFALASFAGLAAAPASAQLFLYDPHVASGPITPSDPLVGIPLPGATPAEAQAGLVWNLRSGLNVAALQCQFSPYLRTVDNYNAVLGQHSSELARAYQTLEGYFRRVNGREGPRRFDDYSTRTYNGFSTLNAQLGFCQVAADIAKDALTRRQGEFHTLATERMRELRNALTPVYDSYAFMRMPIQLAPVTLALPDCSRLRGRERRECRRANRED
jgi:hypothetical protein